MTLIIADRSFKGANKEQKESENVQDSGTRRPAIQVQDSICKGCRTEPKADGILHEIEKSAGNSQDPRKFAGFGGESNYGGR